MSRMRVVLKVFGALVVLVVVAAVGTYLWASSATTSTFAKKYESHAIDFPIPFPLSTAEVDELRAERLRALPEGTAPATDPLAGVDLAALATERAVARGGHLVKARYVCIECHGHDFSGGVMIDDPAVGTAKGPNLTGGKGSRISEFKVSDWDRMVRHGIRPDGTPTLMPASDFYAMSDRELSDIISYIRSLPKIDKESPPIVLGPLLKVLVATKQVRLAADNHPGHDKTHVAEPPTDTDPIVFGKHLAQTCTGCHNMQFTGGKIDGGPPDWAPAANLTALPHTWEQFEQVMRTGTKRDGTSVKLPMTLIVPAAKAMSDKELRALFAYLQSTPAATSPAK